MEAKFSLVSTWKGTSSGSTTVSLKKPYEGRAYEAAHLEGYERRSDDSKCDEDL